MNLPALYKTSRFPSRPGRTQCRPGPHFRLLTASLLLTLIPAQSMAQAAQSMAQAAQPLPAASSAAPATHTADNSRLPTSAERRKAAKLFLEASRLFAAGQFESALRGYEQAVALNPTQDQYAQAATVARSHLATALVHQAAQHRLRGEQEQARAALARALELDPANPIVTQHINQLADDRTAQESKPLIATRTAEIGETVKLMPTSAPHDFHLRSNQQQMIQELFKAYGLSVAIDASVRSLPARLDLEGANFEQAARALEIVTHTFHVPLDPYRVIVAADTAENRQKFLRQQLETLYLPGLSSTELTDMANIAKNVFEIPMAVATPSAGTLTLRGAPSNLDAFSTTLTRLLDGHGQVMIDVKIIQLAHSKGRTTGTQLPQTMSVFNVYAEARSLLTSNQALVDQIVASGLASPGDYVTIIAILLASGQVSNALLSSGFATFGGGAVSTFGLAPGTAGMNFNLNTSESRSLDNLQLRLGDNEPGTVRSGMRYPITTSSYSNLSAASAAVAGLTSAGTSSALSALASTLSSLTSIPMMQYQDLGLTLKATPKLLRGGDVALTVDLKIAALSGQTLNNIPVLGSRAYSGVVTLRDGESQVIVSELDEQETRAISGTPGLSEIPGLNNLSNKSVSRSDASLLILLTPHIVREQQPAGQTPSLPIERDTQPR